MSSGRISGFEDAPLLTKAGCETTDKEGRKWKHIEFNEPASWHSLKKFERWQVVDGMRPHQTLSAAEILPPHP